MDFERIAMLLNVFHMTLELPELKAINAAARAELLAMAAPVQLDLPLKPTEGKRI